MKIISTEQFNKIAKKRKDWDPNPWAICNESVGTEKTPKRERCIKKVKQKQSDMVEPIRRSLEY